MFHQNRTCFAYSFTALFVLGACLLLAVPPLGIVVLVLAVVLQARHQRRMLLRHRAVREGQAAGRLQSQGQAAQWFGR